MINNEESSVKLPSKKINARRKGHNFERKLRKEFIKSGFDKCETSRFSNRLLDNCKVDLDRIPFNIQSKAVESNLNYIDILNDIEKLLKDKFPDRLEYPTVIIHKRKNSNLAIMNTVDFFNLIKMIDYKNYYNNFYKPVN